MISTCICNGAKQRTIVLQERAVQVHDPSVRSCPCIIMKLHFACFSDIICLSLEVHLTSQFCTHSNATIFRCARWTNRRMATTLPTCSLSWWSTIFNRGTHQCCLCYMRYVGFTTNCIYSVTNVLVCMVATASKYIAKCTGTQYVQRYVLLLLLLLLLFVVVPREGEQVKCVQK